MGLSGALASVTTMPSELASSARFKTGVNSSGIRP